jgi:hypothetical protein
MSIGMASNGIDATLAGDLLEGAGAIAQFLFGSSNERRRVYHLVANGQIPCFRMGTSLFARKSTLLTWIGQREQAALAHTD